VNTMDVVFKCSGDACGFQQSPPPNQKRNGSQLQFSGLPVALHQELVGRLNLDSSLEAFAQALQDLHPSPLSLEQWISVDPTSGFQDGAILYFDGVNLFSPKLVEAPFLDLPKTLLLGQLASPITGKVTFLQPNQGLPVLDNGSFLVDASHVDYCSTLQPQTNSQTGTVTPVQVNVAFTEKMTRRNESVRFYLHPQVKSNRLILLIKMETDPDHFKKLTFQELVAIPSDVRDMLSRGSLNRIMDSICANTPQVPHVPEDILREALIEEHSMRVSQEIQTKFSKAELSFDIDWLFVANDIQLSIATKYAEKAEVTVDEFLAAMRYQPVTDFLPIWRKYNRAGRGFLTQGSVAPDCCLFDVQRSKFLRLSDYIKPPPSMASSLGLGGAEQRRITLLLAGSLS